MDKLKSFAVAVQAWAKEHPVFTSCAVCFVVGFVGGLVL